MNLTDSMGRYIDNATDEGRDRLVTAERMNDGGKWWDWDACGCLIGTIAGRETRFDKDQLDMVIAAYRGPSGYSRFDTVQERPDDVGGPKRVWEIVWADAPACVRYPYAVNRFGLEKMTRVLKARAGAEVPNIERVRELVGV